MGKYLIDRQKKKGFFHPQSALNKKLFYSNFFHFWPLTKKKKGFIYVRGNKG